MPQANRFYLVPTIFYYASLYFIYIFFQLYLITLGFIEKDQKITGEIFAFIKLIIIPQKFKINC